MWTFCIFFLEDSRNVLFLSTIFGMGGFFFCLSLRKRGGAEDFVSWVPCEVRLQTEIKDNSLGQMRSFEGQVKRKKTQETAFCTGKKGARRKKGRDKRTRHCTRHLSTPSSQEFINILGTGVYSHFIPILKTRKQNSI